MKKILLLTIVLLGILSSCNTDEPINVSEKVAPVTESVNSQKINLSEALNNVLPLFEALDGSVTTRLDRRAISSVDYITVNNKTRSTNAAGEDTLYYIVNYANDNGFAILSADKRLPAVLGISEKGNINLQDTAYNMPFKMCLNNIENQSTMLLNGFPSSSDTIVPPNFGSYELKMLSKYGPYIEPFPSYWSQNRPYNMRCEKYGFLAYSVGCGPLAVAQIMSYYKWPDKLDELELDWDDINAMLDGPDYGMFISSGLFKESLLQMLRKVQIALEARKGEDGSMSVYESQINDNLQKLGYNKPGNPIAFDKNVSSYIKNGPLLIESKVYQKEDGHMWVMDGIINYKETWAALTNGERYYSLYHCIWGYGGSNNGYFIFDEVLQCIDNEIADDYAEYDTMLQSDIYNAKYYDLKFWKPFIPNK